MTTSNKATKDAAKEDKGWAVSEQDDNGNWHVVPVDDTMVHMDEDCPCNPKPDPESPHVIVHNAQDKREIEEKKRGLH